MCLQMLQGAQQGSLFHNGARGWLGQNNNMWESWENCAQGFTVKLSQGSDGFLLLTGWAQQTVIFETSQLVSNVLYSGFIESGQASLLKESRVDTVCWQVLWSALSIKQVKQVIIIKHESVCLHQH